METVNIYQAQTNRFFRTYCPKILGKCSDILGNINRLTIELLNLPGVIVEKSLQTEDRLILFVKSRRKQ